MSVLSFELLHDVFEKKKRVSLMYQSEVLNVSFYPRHSLKNECSSERRHIMNSIFYSGNFLKLHFSPSHSQMLNFYIIFVFNHISDKFLAIASNYVCGTINIFFNIHVNKTDVLTSRLGPCIFFCSLDYYDSRKLFFANSS